MSIQSSPLRDRMIFVVGARRSGTNWIGRIIGSHPEVARVQSESHLFTHGIAPLAELFQHGSKGSWQIGKLYMERDALLGSLRDFCDAAFMAVLDSDETGATRLLERSPHHSRVLDLIGSIYPDAHVVHIIRDGRDVARSLVQMDWGPDTIEDAAAEWVESVAAARAAAPALEHYHEVRYEDLFSDTSQVVERVLDELGLDTSGEILEHAMQESSWTYNADPTAPAIALSKWRDSLSGDQLTAIDAIAGPLLHDLGYPPSGAPAPRPAVAPPAAEKPAPTRSVLRSVGRRVLRPSGRTGERADAARLQLTVDDFLAAAREGRADDAVALCKPRIQVHVAQPGARWEQRGMEAAQRLVTTMIEDQGFAAAQRRCDVWPSPSQFTVVLETDHEDTVHQRALVLYLDSVGISRAAYYAFD